MTKARSAAIMFPIPQTCMHTGTWSKSRTTQKEMSIVLYDQNQGKRGIIASLPTAVPIAASMPCTLQGVPLWG